MGVQLEGFDELRAKLNSMGEKVARKYAAGSLRPAALLVQSEARSLAPYRTGRLRQAIQVNNPRSRGDEVSITVAPGAKFFKGDQFYGGLQEFGWFLGARLRGKQFKGKFGAERYRDASIKAGRRFIEGRHYMFRAYEGTKGACEELIAGEMTRAIREDWDGR